MNAIKEAIELVELEQHEDIIARRSLLEHVANAEHCNEATETQAAQYLTNMTFDLPALSSEQLFIQATKIAKR